jgi:hypothetical protein
LTLPFFLLACRSGTADRQTPTAAPSASDARAVAAAASVALPRSRKKTMDELSMIVITVTKAELEAQRPFDPEADLWEDKAHRISDDPPTYEIGGLATDAAIARLRSAGFNVRVHLNRDGMAAYWRRIERETNRGGDAE